MASKISALILNDVLPRMQITSADTRVTYANLLSYCQKVYEDLFYSIVDQNPEIYGTLGYAKFFANQPSCTLSANIADYDLSQTWLKVDIKESTSAEYKTAMEVSWNDITNPNATFSWDKPVFSLYGDLMYVWPLPTADVVSGAKIYHTEAVSSLSGNVAHNLPSGWEDALINGVVYHGLEQLGESNRSVKFLNDYQIEKSKRLQEVSRRSKTRRRMRDIRENYFGTYFE